MVTFLLVTLCLMLFGKELLIGISAAIGGVIALMYYIFPLLVFILAVMSYKFTK